MQVAKGALDIQVSFVKFKGVQTAPQKLAGTGAELAPKIAYFRFEKGNPAPVVPQHVILQLLMLLPGRYGRGVHSGCLLPHAPWSSCVLLHDSRLGSAGSLSTVHREDYIAAWELVCGQVVPGALPTVEQLVVWHRNPVVGRGAASLLTFDASMFAGIRLAPGGALDVQAAFARVRGGGGGGQTTPQS